ncbi:MAG: hypothetical protein HFF50_08340 [Lawsonibacter sp.]|nr:hypothetical protein [Lawsonibacter sp.]
MEIRPPHPDWPWTLSESGTIQTRFVWADIEYNLAELYPSSDSFLILEQKDPENPKNYWFIQSAIALRGPEKDNYIVGVGWNGAEGPVLLERCYHWKKLDTVIEIFERAFRREALDLTGYESFFD